jgi:2-dehydro-3-deoxyglucarate aldolase/4-hydroxy-2-oxoheptanedioate aldolase
LSDRLKTLLAGGELVRVFACGRMFHPAAIEMFALAGGYHGFWIDQEHTGITSEQIVTAALTGRACGLDSLVRMAPTDYSLVTQNLECGVGGVMAAQIQSADHAETFVRWTKFAPRGNRGLNSTARDADYTHKPIAQFVVDANEQHLVAIQIETLGALEQVDEIAAIDGVDMLFVGPADLSLALGVVGEFHSDRLWTAIDRVAAACRNRGKPWGVVPADPAFADRAIASGCRLLTVGNDLLVMRRGIDAMKTSFRSLFE